MPRTFPTLLRPMATIALLMALIGCDKDERLAELGRESCRRQAEQNATIARQNEQTAELSKDFLKSENEARRELIAAQEQLAQADAASREKLATVQKELIERDAQGREQLNALQQDVQAAARDERQAIGRQRDGLEAERQKLAEERKTAPVVAAAVTQLGLIFACLLPLLLCGYLIYVSRQPDDADAAVAELLVGDLIDRQSSLLLPHVQSAAAPAISSDPATIAQGEVP